MLQEKPSALKRERPEPQNMKFLNFFLFCGSILPSWIRFPRKQTQNWVYKFRRWLNPDPIRIRIQNTGRKAEKEGGTVAIIATLAD